MNTIKRNTIHIVIHFFIIGCFWAGAQNSNINSLTLKVDPETVFKNPPESAKPGALWMWMGANISKEGITKDLEALKNAGFNRTTMFSLADVTTPWAGNIEKSPTPQIISWTERWWELVRFAAQESKRLQMDFGMFNCPGYTASGGKWISSENSMKELIWSEKKINITQKTIKLDKPSVNLRAKQPFPVYNPNTNLVEKPIITERETYYKDIAVIAVPSSGIVSKNDIIDLTGKMKSDGSLNWTPPSGEWSIYRFGYTTMGTLIQPAQWEATGFEVDKLDPVAIKAYFENYLDQYKSATSGLIGDKGGLQYIVTDSWEAGAQNWTKNLPAEFAKRRGYSLLPWMPTLTGQIIKNSEASEKFLWDYRKTLSEMVSEYHYDQLTTLLHERGMKRYSESHEAGRALIADGMEVKRNADIPMGAMWTPGQIGADGKTNNEEIR